MITLSRTMIFWLSFLIFWSGLCIGAGIYSYVTWRKRRKDAQSELDEEANKLAKFVRKKRAHLRSIDGGKKN